MIFESSLRHWTLWLLNPYAKMNEKQSGPTQDDVGTPPASWPILCVSRGGSTGIPRPMLLPFSHIFVRPVRDRRVPQNENLLIRLTGQW